MITGSRKLRPKIAYAMFGTIETKGVEFMSGVGFVEEDAFDKYGYQVGFWAYGHWSPYLPYRGYDE